MTESRIQRFNGATGEIILKGGGVISCDRLEMRDRPVVVTVFPLKLSRVATVRVSSLK